MVNMQPVVSYSTYWIIHLVRTQNFPIPSISDLCVSGGKKCFLVNSAYILIGQSVYSHVQLIWKDPSRHTNRKNEQEKRKKTLNLT